jgi:dimethyladenosine transferase 1
MLEEASDVPMDVVMGDVLSFNMEKHFPEEALKAWSSNPPNIHLIGNLPFNVATPLIIRWIKDISYR